MASFTLALDSVALGLGPGAMRLSGVWYAVITDGRVSSVRAGVVPTNTSTVYYHRIPAADALPAVGAYFADVCQTFQSGPPTIPPGEIAPPFPPGSLDPPAPDDPDYPDFDLPDEDRPIPLANTAPILLSFHADAEADLAHTTSSSAEEELDPRMRTRIDLRDVCALRVQAYVDTALAGAEVVLFGSADNGYSWDELSPGKTGPAMPLDAAGNIEGLFTNIDPIFQAGEVLVSPFVRGATGTLALGNLLATLFVKTSAGACVEIVEVVPEACAVPETANGALVFDQADLGAWYTANSGLFDAKLISIWWVGTSETAGLYIDELDEYAGSFPLVYDYESDPFDSAVPGDSSWGSGNADVAVFAVVDIGAALADGAGAFTTLRGFNLARFTCGNDNIAFCLTGGRIRIDYDCSPGGSGSVDLGPATDLTGTRKQVICRVVCTGTTIQAFFYIDDPCDGTPVAPTLYGSTTALSSDEDDVQAIRYFVQNVTMGAGAVLKLYQLTTSADPVTDFNLP